MIWSACWHSVAIVWPRSRFIESLNAFCLGQEEDGQAIMYCKTCGSYRLASVAGFSEQLRNLARQAGFVLQRTIIELAGQSDRCGSQRNKG
jgi:Fe2+ or Zn2+ uptake regulation protein